MLQLYATEQFFVPKNEHSLLVNEEVLHRLPGIEKMYKSVDDVECEDFPDQNSPDFRS
jgi:hypothetical protein